MGDKKETIKKNLGISEYPWSSDDEFNDVLESSSALANADINTLDPRPVNVLRTRPVNSQSQPSTSTHNVATTSYSHSQPSTSSRRAPVSRMERNIFWSLICPRRHGDIRSRIRDAQPHDTVRPLQVSRRPEVRTSPMKDISKVLTFTKANRHLLYKLGMNNPNSFSVSRGSSSILPTKNPLFAPGLRSSMHESSRNGNPGSSRSSEPQPSTSGLYRERHRSPERTNNVLNHSDECMILDNETDDDLDSPRQDKNDSYLDTRLQDKNDSSTSNAANQTGNAEISLEEEVLEVEPVEGSSADNNINQTQNNEQGNVVKEPEKQVASTSTPTDPNRSLKKRRDSSVRDDTVKELNQCLLRLLECPVCLEWMEPPMSQCRRGHLVCVKCRSRLSTCPVCRTTFSSVRNRAMEGVAEILRYPCRHGCGREVRLRTRTRHESSCSRRKHACLANQCGSRPPMTLPDLKAHLTAKHLNMVRTGNRHKFAVKVNTVQQDTWFILAFEELFHLRVDVDIRTWGVTVYVAYVGPKNKSKKYCYGISIEGKHNMRTIDYNRCTHSDLESVSVNIGRQDCFYLSLDQALNFLRMKNRPSESENCLHVTVTLSENNIVIEKEESDS